MSITIVMVSYNNIFLNEVNHVTILQILRHDIFTMGLTTSDGGLTPWLLFKIFEPDILCIYSYILVKNQTENTS